MKLKPRKIAEAVAEKILMASGYLTSIVIVLIVVFLFREGAGLFDSPAVEQGYVLTVNRANPVQSLTPEQIKKYTQRFERPSEMRTSPTDQKRLKKKRDNVR